MNAPIHGIHGMAYMASLLGKIDFGAGFLIIHNIVTTFFMYMYALFFHEYNINDYSKSFTQNTLYIYKI